MNPLHSRLSAIAAASPADLGLERPEPRRRAGARRFMSAVDIGLTGLVALCGATVLSGLLVFLASLVLTGAIEAGRWVLVAGSQPSLHVLALVEFSAVGGLILGAMACAVFASDLRRQRWI